MKDGRRPIRRLPLPSQQPDPEGQALSYRFDPGDGSEPTAWGSSNTFDYAYSDDGHYRASVQIRDAQGGLVSDGVTVTVVTPVVGPYPTHSSAIALDDTLRRVYGES